MLIWCLILHLIIILSHIGVSCLFTYNMSSWRLHSSFKDCINKSWINICWMDKWYVFILIKTMRYLSNFFYLFLQFRVCLYLGGNFIKEIPPELGNLPSKLLGITTTKSRVCLPSFHSEYFQEFMCAHTSLLRDYCPFTHMVVYVEKN